MNYGMYQESLCNNYFKIIDPVTTTPPPITTEEFDFTDDAYDTTDEDKGNGIIWYYK